MFRQVWLLLAVLALPLVALAQDDAATDAETASDVADVEEVTVPYFHSSASFNVPVLIGWENQSEGDTALFTNEDYNATLLVTRRSDGVDALASIQLAMTQLVPGDDLPGEIVFNDSIALADGRWYQYALEVGDTGSVTARALERPDYTYVILLYENHPDGNIYSRIVRNPEAEAGAEVAPDAGLQIALEAFVDPDFSATPDDSRTETLPSGLWLHRQYNDVNGTQIDAYGFVFGNATYTMIVTGGLDERGALTNALNTTFLGFFLTPENQEYLYLGLISVAAIMLVLVGSFYMRYRGAQKDAETLAQLAEDDA